MAKPKHPDAIDRAILRTRSGLAERRVERATSALEQAVGVAYAAGLTIEQIRDAVEDQLDLLATDEVD